jgi:chromosome segregation ATPase
MTQDINSLTKSLDDDIKTSLATLQNRLRKVEQELDLECSNLRDLVQSKNPEINNQLDALGESISELHESLSEVRGHLKTADSESDDLEEVATEATEAYANESSGGKDVDLSARDIGRLRHDEKVTLAGIFRGLLMADEPQQRTAKDEDKD